MTRIGLIGAGRWGRNAARAMSKAGVLAWVADDDMENAHAVASEFGAERVRSGPMIDTLADKWSDIRVHGLGDCDAVWICTPIETHELLVHAALSAGKHVLCEKPLSRSKAQAAELAADAERRGLVLMADHTWRAHLGASILINKSAGHYSAQRWAKDARGFDALEDLLPHDIALSSWMYGTDATAVRVDGGLVVLRYNIAAGERFASMSYDYDNDEKRRRLVTDRGENNGELPEGAPEPLSVILDEFIASIREQRQPRIGGAAEFIHVAAVIEAAKASRAKGGEWVDVQ